ncbi:MAG: GAF domain-containing protein, partial [Syntrophobacterales bacterium]
MKDEDKTKRQLINELVKMRQRITELKGSEAERKRTENLIYTQRDLSLALGATRRLDETLRLCVEAAIRCSGMDCGGVYLVDETSGNLDLEFQKGLSPDFIESVSHYDACSANARLVMAGNPIYTRFQELGVPLGQTARNEGLRAIAVIPVRYEDRVIGCLNVASHTLDAVPDFARTALESITNQIGDAIIRSKMEEELRESEERLKTLVTSAPIGFSIIAKDGTYEYVNPKFVEIFGYTLEDVPTGKKWFEKAYPDPEYRKEAISCWMENLREAEVGETRPRVFAVACKDGSKKWIFFRPVGLTGGKQLVTYEDITER